MSGLHIRGMLLAVIAVPLLTGCLAREHPDFDRYEYLYIEGVLQSPYTEFPTGADRADWRCYDGRVNREFDCTFVHGGWELYQYIYRPRSPGRPARGGA